MQNLAVVYFPKINFDTINSFREKYDPSYSIIPPHITIVSPLSHISEDQLIAYVEQIARNVRSFPIHFIYLVRSLDGYLFLVPKEGNNEVVNLYEKLYSGELTSYKMTHVPFAPHITLGFFWKEDGTFDDIRYAKAYAEAEASHLDMTCMFDALSVIRGDGVNPAVTVKTIALQKSA